MKVENEANILREVQKIQLEILLEFDRLCKKHNIIYQLYAGTLLGAVRHKGFIPWDDDIDVCLLREDYERFIKICKLELSDQYFLQTSKTDSDFIMQYAKIRKNKTLFVENSTSDTKMHKGIYIDVFPLDNVNSDKIVGKVQFYLLFLMGRLNLTRNRQHCQNIENSFKKSAAYFGHYIMKIVPKSLFNNTYKKVLCLLMNKNTKYVNHLTNGVSKHRFQLYMRNRKTFSDITNIEFEGHLFPAPKKFKEVLKQEFGNYMKLPPIDQQCSHHGVINIDLGKDLKENI